MQGQQALGVFEGHAEQSRHPHPEHCSGPAKGHGGSNPGDIAGADGSGQSGAQGLKMGNFPFVVGIIVFSGNQFPGVTETTQLNQPEQQGDKDPAAHQQYNRDRTPDPAAQRIDQRLHNNPP